VGGIAQTQERVSEFLRNTAYSSDWLVKPELIESRSTSITSANREQKRLYEFSVRLTVKRPQDVKAAADAASAVPASPAASSPMAAKKAA
jgi:type IV pilus assembly protein PilN